MRAARFLAAPAQSFMPPHGGNSSRSYMTQKNLDEQQPGAGQGLNLAHLLHVSF
jgi:hypothetical protein